MLPQHQRRVRLARGPALWRVRFRLRLDRPQGARLAVGRCGPVRRVRRVPRQPRSLALHRRDTGGKAADRGGVITAASHSAAIAIAEWRILAERGVPPSPPPIRLVSLPNNIGPNSFVFNLPP